MAKSRPVPFGELLDHFEKLGSLFLHESRVVFEAVEA